MPEFCHEIIKKYIEESNQSKTTFEKGRHNQLAVKKSTGLTLNSREGGKHLVFSSQQMALQVIHKK
jgi:hypothetical protein